MKKVNTNILVYTISGLFYFLSTIFQLEIFTYAFKPLLIGALFFYYLEERKKNINIYFIILFVLLFISGTINLIEGNLYFLYVLLFNLSAYCIFLFQIGKKIYKPNITIQENVNIMYLLITFVFLISLFYTSSYIVFDPTFEFYILILLYGLILFSIGILSTYIYLISPTKQNTYLVLFALSIIICDLFYGIYYYYFNLASFRYLSIICYILSFYFLTNFFILDEKKAS